MLELGWFAVVKESSNVLEGVWDVAQVSPSRAACNLTICARVKDQVVLS